MNKKFKENIVESINCYYDSSYFPCFLKTEPIFCNVVEILECSSVPNTFL